jgi:predicted SAM-dependent methyltransferase
MKKYLRQVPFIYNLVLNIRHSRWRNKTINGLKIYLQGNDNPKLQLGAGQNALPGWFNTDYFPRPEIFFLDVTKTFSMPPDSFDFIFTEHHIEHISYKHAVFMLKESYKVLKPGGVIRIATPDLRNSLSDYLNDDAAKKGLSHSNEFLLSGFYKAINYIPVDDYTKAHQINDMFYNYEHQFIYDFESLERILKSVGFINIKDSSQKDSIHKSFLNIESHNSDFDKYFTLTVEAEKQFNKV